MRLEPIVLKWDTLKSVAAVLLAVWVASPISVGDCLAADTEPKAPAANADESLLDFVREHHRELVPLLTRLKRQSPGEYQAAVRDIRAVQERIARLNGKGDHSELNDRAAYELEKWKIDSRIRLLTARIVSLMGQSTEGVEHPGLAAARKDLRELSRQRVQLDRDRLEREKRLLLTRLEKLQQQADRIDDDMDAAVERQFKSITKTIENAAKRHSAKARRAGAAGSTKKKTPESPKNENRPSSSNVESE